MIREAAKNRNQTLIEHLAELRSQAVKLSKAKRYIKHVMGFSQEALQRMVNGTQTTDSAWGPHKVIRGTSDSKEGDVWGSRAPAGRKRRDAEWFRERAIKGNDKAQLQLGLAYMEGAGVPRNESRGAGWLARSARQGNLRAMHELALCYEFGEGVRRSNSSAVQLLKQAARKGFMRAQEDLGVAHMDGRLGLPPDARKALPGLRLAAQGGSRRAHTRLGVVFAEGRDGVERDETQAEMHLQKAARSYRTGHLSGNSAAGSEVREGARALYKLAKRFLDGKGVRQDHFKAVDWAARSSIKGYTPATLMLADCYSAGLGVPRDEKIALRCYRNAALRGDSRGAVEMSKRLLLLSRQENDEDKAKEARRWLHMTALDGDSEAACLLAYCWVNGTGGDQDAGEARRLFLQAATAENPSPDAQFQLAIRSGADGAVDPLLLKDTHDASGGGVGGGVLQVWSSGAEALLRAAADGGHLEAMYSLGKWLVEGRSGVVVEDARMEGVEWLRKAGEAGSALGMARLGKCFAEGIGVEKDEEEAALWISRGRDGGEDADMEWVLDAAQRGVLEAKRLVAAVMLEGGEEEEAAGGKVVVLPSGERVTRAIAETIKELAELGDAESMYRYGAWLAEAGDGAGRSRGLAMLEEAAEDKECGEAMSILGQAHARGLYGLMPSDTEAVRWFAQGAEAGLSEAQFKLGAMYEHARGVPRDMFMAAEWYSEAAEQGHADAAFALGVCYARGRGIKKDHEMAVYWYSRAAHLGHGRAQFNLALRYADGALAGVKKDPHLATKWFKAAIANGIKGPNVKLKNGVLQNFAKLEMRQELVDTPKTHDAHGGAKKAERTRVMKMSAYKAIRWNRNPSSYRNGAQSLGIILRSEGKKVPRFVEIDDPKAKDFGRLYPTRPDMESREKILSTLLVAHGTNWEEMAVDGRNHLEWDVGRLRKGCVSMMEKRLKYPPAYFDKAERQQIPRFGKLLKSYKAERAAKKARVEETAAILAANDGDNRLRIRALDRREQLQSARALAVLQIPGLDTRALLTGGRKGKSTIKHEGQGVQAIAGIAVEEVLRLNYLPTDDEDGDYLPAFEEQGTERGGETLQLEGGITEHDGVLDEIWDEEGNVVSRAGDEEEGGALVTRGDEEGAALVAGDAKEGGGRWWL
ncbi:hypothetical protein T484DRAFT_3371099 [Baffinella frigidus]|nr:hypothetical protein T484DRAFT_3371099 [Cryptophyta sp. CCMP2293]